MAAYHVLRRRDGRVPRPTSTWWSRLTPYVDVMAAFHVLRQRKGRVHVLRRRNGRVLRLTST